MVDQCPCCSPPWKVRQGLSIECLYVGRSKESIDSTFRLWQYDMAGNLVGELWSLEDASRTISDIAVNPITGTIYFVTGSEGTITAVDPDGLQLWTADEDSLWQLYAVAVDANNFVYWGGLNYKIHKTNGTTGVEVTAGGWPYTPTGTPPLIIRGLCVDKAGNVYASGNRVGGGPGSGTDCLKLDTDGTLAWEVTLTSGSTSGVGISINPANDTLYVGHTSSAAVNNVFEVNPTDGSATAITAGILVVGDTTYDKDGNRFVSVNGTIWRNGALFYTLPGGVNPTGLTVDRTTGNIYATQFKRATGDRVSVICLNSSGTLVWAADPGATDYANSAFASAIESSRGRVGAFGL